MITLKRAPAVDGTSEPDSCCSTKRAPKHDNGDSKEPTQEQKKNCAVCYHARGICPTPVFDFDPKPTDVTILARLFEPTKIHRAILLPPYDAHAPPAC